MRLHGIRRQCSEAPPNNIFLVRAVGEGEASLGPAPHAPEKALRTEITGLHEKQCRGMSGRSSQEQHKPSPVPSCSYGTVNAKDTDDDLTWDTARALDFDCNRPRSAV